MNRKDRKRELYFQSDNHAPDNEFVRCSREHVYVVKKGSEKKVSWFKFVKIRSSLCDTIHVHPPQLKHPRPAIMLLLWVQSKGAVRVKGRGEVRFGLESDGDRVLRWGV
jgi:hypothetical protein